MKVIATLLLAFIVPCAIAQVLVTKQSVKTIIQGILVKSFRLKHRILTVLEQNALDAGKSGIAQMWAAKKEWDVSYAQSLLVELKRGIDETLDASSVK